MNSCAFLEMIVMGSIETRKGKRKTTYRVVIKRKGFPSFSESFDRLTDAKACMRKVEAEMDRGSYKAISEAKKHTLWTRRI